MIGEALDDERVNRGEAPFLVEFGAEDHAGADAVELHGGADCHRIESGGLQNHGLPRFRRCEDRCVLLSFEIAHLIAFARRDADVSAAEDSAQSAAFEAGLDDPESRPRFQSVIHRRIH